MKKIIVITVLAVIMLTACEPVSVPDVSDVIPDIVNQEPKPDEKPEDKPPADVPPAENTSPSENVPEDTPPAEVQMVDIDILAPIVGKKYISKAPYITAEGDPAFEIKILKAEDGYQLYDILSGNFYPIVKGKDFKYRIDEYEISVSEDGKKITIGESVYEGTD